MSNSVFIVDRENCCGCGVCTCVCPRRAIKMVEDQEGFFYPVIDFTKCVECGLCVKVCIMCEN